MPFHARENFLNALNNRPIERIPVYGGDSFGVGFGRMPGPWYEKGPVGGGRDGFGVRWVTSASGAGAPIPAPGEFLIEDIGDWKKISFPDLDAFDYAKAAETDLAHYDGAKALLFGSGNAPFERLAAVMGFENALISMYDDPDACYDFMEAVAQHKIREIKKVAKYYRPDMYMYYDDIATERNLFMAPEVYRRLIKPHHAAICKACKEEGIIPVQHTCGKADELIADFIEVGAKAWHNVQITNDIRGMLERYGDRFCFIGGYDTMGEPSLPGATEEIRRAYVRKALEEFGAYRGYIFSGAILTNSYDAALIGKNMAALVEEAIAWRDAHIG